ncbi:MAG: uroporphyrinogen-III synthase [Sideroxydans sp.]|nr:uroporphyrinogen-III synthase [Sideroxydans sp.]
MAASLSGLNIVITRPREQALELTQRIQQQGGNVLLFPLLDIAPANNQVALHAFAQRVASYDFLIFISPNAVKYGLAALGKIPPSVKVASVGQSSAQALRDSGISHVIAPTERFDSESLLALPELTHVMGQRIAILRGDGGRELLGDTLKERGAKIEYITCYQRSKPELDPAALYAAQPDALTVTSSEALAHLWQMLDNSDKSILSSLPLFVPHPRIAALAHEQGWQNIFTTASGDDGLLAALVAWSPTARN